MSLGIIIQARTGSKRLPNKLVLPFYKENNLIDVVIKNIIDCSFVNKIILATTKNPNDDCFDYIKKQYNLSIFRGEEKNVLKRFINAAQAFEISSIVRICSDNPFISKKYLDYLIIQANDADYDYVSYSTKENIPSIKTHYGFFCEYVKLDALEKIYSMTSDAIYLEHVTNYIYDNNNKFKIKYLKIPFEENNRIRLTIDTLEDFNLCKEIYRVVYDTYNNTEPLTIINYLNENPFLFDRMNNQIKLNLK